MGCCGSGTDVRQQVAPAPIDANAQLRETAPQQAEPASTVAAAEHAQLREAAVPVEPATALLESGKATTTDLREYFEKHYREGGEFLHPDYEKTPDATLHTWLHKPTDIQIWQDAIDLTSGTGGQVVFHYTSEVGFHNITHPSKEASEIWASLNTEGPNANAWWGKGVYTVPWSPDQWRDRDKLLDNNFRNMMRRDHKDPIRGPEYVKREYPKRAAFCVPILVDGSNAFDVSKKATPEMEAAGKEPGRNLAGKLLNEPGMPPRCCIVVRVSGEDGAVQHARGRLLVALRSRAARAEGEAGREAKWRLGEVLRGRGCYEEASPILRELQEFYETTHAPESRWALASANNLALCLEQMGKYTEAEELYRRATQAMERALGPDHPDTLKCINNLANVLLQMGQYTDAEKLYRRVMQAMERVLGPDRPYTLKSINNLANVLLQMGKYTEAEELQRRALEGNQRTLGPDHPDTLASVNNLACVLEKMAKYDEAEVLSRQSVEVCERALGPEHPATLLFLETLADILSGMEKSRDAEVLYRRVCDAYERTLGPQHPNTLRSLKSLAGLLEGEGRHSDALELCRRMDCA
ncbi:unnamed protein product [Durusdinium trenchii]|uniref:Kinesin light chain n=1 Tax=Durusdinium trenchii TaxID=1381693 RepID=A0ABP0PSR8_9DINO